LLKFSRPFLLSICCWFFYSITRISQLDASVWCGSTPHFSSSCRYCCGLSVTAAFTSATTASYDCCWRIGSDGKMIRLCCFCYECWNWRQIHPLFLLLNEKSGTPFTFFSICNNFDGSSGGIWSWWSGWENNQRIGWCPAPPSKRPPKATVADIIFVFFLLLATTTSKGVASFFIFYRQSFFLWLSNWHRRSLTRCHIINSQFIVNFTCLFQDLVNEENGWVGYLGSPLATLAILGYRPALGYLNTYTGCPINIVPLPILGLIIATC
jgi:hypothetical protein